jgi:O-antigen ligase
VNCGLIVLCFVSVLALGSQSAASYATYLLALAMLVTFRDWDDVFSVRFLWLILALLCYLGASTFWSTPAEPGEAASILVRAFLIVMFVVAFAECQLRGELQRWLGRALTLVGTAAALAAIVYFAETRDEYGRLMGLGQLDNPNVAVLVYAVVLIFALDILFGDASRRWRAAAAGCAGVLVFAVFLTGSRAGWISTASGVSAFVLAQRVASPGRFAAVAAGAAAILAAVIGVLLADDSMREILLPRGDSYRPAIWTVVLSNLTDAGIWFGAGINTSDDIIVAGHLIQHAHNMYLSVAWQGGVIALAMFVGIIVWALRTLYLNYAERDAKLAVGCFAIALTAYCFDGHELVDKVSDTWFLFWLPVAICLGYRWHTPRLEP